MSRDQIKYREGYKYQLAEDYTIQISIYPIVEIETEFIRLDRDGYLLIRRGYAWDGPSGPTCDTVNSMRGSLVHDALYQLMRQGHLLPELRDEADVIAYKIWREDGMGAFRAALWKRELGKWAANAADPRSKKKVLVAPHNKYSKS